MFSALSRRCRAALRNSRPTRAGRRKPDAGAENGVFFLRVFLFRSDAGREYLSAMAFDSPKTALDNESEAPPLNRLEVLRGLRIAIWEGSFASVWTAMTTGIFLTGYALWIGANSVVLGLVTAIPTIAALAQIVSSYFGERLPARRPLTAWTSLAGRTLWLPILLLPLILPRSQTLLWFLVLYTLSYILLNIPAPAYLSWMSDLVPPDHRGRYFGRRNMIMGVVGLVAGLPAAWFLDFATRRHHWEGLGFGVLFGVGVAGGLLSFAMLLRQAEPPKRRQEAAERPTGWAGARDYYRAPFADKNFMRLMRFNVLFGIGQTIAAPFYIAYALSVLKFDYAWLQIFATLASVASLASMPLWGYLSDKFGNKPLLAISVVGTFTLPLYWVAASPAHHDLAVFLLGANNLTAGFFWAGFGLLQFNLLIRMSPPEKTQVYVAMMAAVTGLTSGLAPLVGGALLNALTNWQGFFFGYSINNYQLLFLIAAVLRLSGLIYLRPLQDADALSMRAALTELGRSRPRVWRSIRRLQNSADEGARLEATESLGGTRALLATSELETGLRDPRPAVRSASARALGEIADASSLSALRAALRDPAAGIAAEAATALARIGSPEATPDLIALLHKPGRTAAERQAAIRALGTIGGAAALSALTALFSAGPNSETAAIAAALGELRAESAAPALLQHLKTDAENSANMELKAALIQALGEIGSPAAMPVLLDLLANAETDRALIPALADALARLNVAEALPLLLPRLEGLASEVARKQTAAAIGVLMGEGETAYRLLAQEDMARETTVAKILQEMQRRARNSPFAAEAEAWRDEFSRGDFTDCLRRLPALLAEIPAPPQTHRDTPAALCRAFLLQTAPLTAPTPETLLLVLTALRFLIFAC